MRRWLVALVAVAAFGAGWIVHDVADDNCTVTTDQRGIYENGTITKDC